MSTHQNAHQTSEVQCVGCSQSNGEPTPATRIVVQFDDYDDYLEHWPYCAECAEWHVDSGGREYPLEAFYEQADYPPVRQIYEDDRTIQLYTDGPEPDTDDPDEPTEWIEATNDGRISDLRLDTFVHDLKHNA